MVGFVVDLYFDEIVASVAHAKQQKSICVEHLRKVWHIYMNTYQKKLNVKSHRGVRTNNPKFSRNIGTVDRMLRYKLLSKFFLWVLSFVKNKSGNNIEVTHAAIYLLLIMVSFML